MEPYNDLFKDAPLKHYEEVAYIRQIIALQTLASTQRVVHKSCELIHARNNSINPGGLRVGDAHRPQKERNPDHMQST